MKKFNKNESVAEIVMKPNVITDRGLMDVYGKEGYKLKVGVKKYLNGDYSNNGSAVELYTFDADWNDSDWDPKFFVTISSKDGGVISDDDIKSHVEIFYSAN